MAQVPGGVEEKEKDAIEFACRAVKMDEEEKYEASIYYYKVVWHLCI